MANETRFSRWSRMKAKSRPAGRGIFAPARLADEPETPAPPEPAEAVPAPISAEPPPVPEVAVEDGNPEPGEEAYPEDLPDLDTLDKNSDFSVFMSSRVSDAIRNKALRKLWLTDPTLANLDGLVDYGEDITGAVKIMSDGMKSVYKVGRGMVEYLDQDADETDAAPEREAVPESTDGSDTESAPEETPEETPELVSIEKQEDTPGPDAETQGTEPDSTA